MHNSEWPLGPELRRHRLAAGLSQREAARRSGISESKWRQLETGTLSMGEGQTVRVNTRPETATAAAGGVGMDPADALRLAGFDPAAHPELVDAARREPDDRIPGAARLTPRQRQAVIEMVQAIVETDDEPTGVRPGTPPADLAERGTVLGRTERSRPRRARRAENE